MGVAGVPSTSGMLKNVASHGVPCRPIEKLLIMGSISRAILRLEFKYWHLGRFVKVSMSK